VALVHPSAHDVGSLVAPARGLSPFDNLRSSLLVTLPQLRAWQDRHVAAVAELSSQPDGDELDNKRMTGLIVSLIKSLLGAAILTLSSGLASVSDSPWITLPGAVVMMFFAAMSAHTYVLIGKCCDEMGASSYTELWSLTVSPGTAYIPTTACLAFTAVLCQIYCIIVRDMLVPACVRRTPHALLYTCHIQCSGKPRSMKTVYQTQQMLLSVNRRCFLTLSASREAWRRESCISWQWAVCSCPCACCARSPESHMLRAPDS